MPYNPCVDFLPTVTQESYMDAHTITIYRSRDTLRVVKGEHKPHAGSSTCTVTVYPSAQLAYATEKNDDVRAAILRIDLQAAGGESKFVPAPFNVGKRLKDIRDIGFSDAYEGKPIPTEFLSTTFEREYRAGYAAGTAAKSADVQAAMGIGCTCSEDLLLVSQFSDSCPIHGKGQ